MTSELTDWPAPSALDAFTKDSALFVTVTPEQIMQLAFRHLGRIDAELELASDRARIDELALEKKTWDDLRRRSGKYFFAAEFNLVTRAIKDRTDVDLIDFDWKTQTLVMPDGKAVHWP